VGDYLSSVSTNTDNRAITVVDEEGRPLTIYPANYCRRLANFRHPRSSAYSMTKLSMPKCRNEPISEFLSDLKI